MLVSIGATFWFFRSFVHGLRFWRRAALLPSRTFCAFHTIAENTQARRKRSPPLRRVRGQGRRQQAGSSKNRLPKACTDTPGITDTGGNAALRGICQNAPRVYPNDLLLTINLIESVVLGVQVLPVTPSEIAASFAKILRWLALPYSSYCQRLAALSFGKVEPLYIGRLKYRWPEPRVFRASPALLP